jgi:prevent-host-death family protein
MVRVTGEQLQKQTGYVRAEARRGPVEVTYHGRPELVIISVEDYALLRQGRKIPMHISEAPIDMLEAIASARMDSAHDHLNDLLDD